MLRKIIPKEHNPHHKHLVRAFENFRKVELQEFRSYLKSPWRIFWANFLAGTARGLGLLIGVAVVLGLVGFIIKDILANIPYVGEFFQALEVWIKETLQQTP